MPTEKEKMLNGELYKSWDPQLSQERHQARILTGAFNTTQVDRQDQRREILAKLLGSFSGRVYIEPPFYCDYGYNIHLGRDVYFNSNCIILDVARVDIGDAVLFGPNVQIYTATHSLDIETRRTGMELGKPIRIGSEAWIGGSAVILPGVTIGARTVIGAGSVVTRDIPDDVFAAGNPCKIIRHLGSPDPQPQSEI